MKVHGNAVTTTPNKRGPTSNKYALALQGRHCGWLTDVAGALAVGELGGEGRSGRYEELALRCWPGMPEAFYRWVVASLADPPEAQDGELVLADDGFSEISRLGFRAGVVTELSLPEHEAGLADRTKLRVKFSPQSMRRSYHDGYISGEAVDTRKPAPATEVALHIDGLEEASSQVRRIEGLAVRQRVERVRADEGVLVRRVGPLQIDPLHVILAENRAHGFVRWLQSCEAGKSNGRVATLALGLASVGFTLELSQVRPMRITEEPGAEAEDGRRKEVRVVLGIRAVRFAFAPRHMV